MATQTLRAESAQVIRLSDYRARPPAPAAWQNDISCCCLYAECLKADHAAERAKINLEQKERGIRYWWHGPQDIRDRVDANNRQWELYRALLKHIAALPAKTRSEGQLKRNAIGKMWLSAGDGWNADLRAGCEADDHLFPKSLKLAKEARCAN